MCQPTRYIQIEGQILIISNLLTTKFPGGAMLSGGLRSGKVRQLPEFPGFNVLF
jgi:hypothetical protein